MSRSKTSERGVRGPAPSADAYPADRETDIALRDGSTLHVRPVRPEDETALAEFFGGLSEESRALRFFSGGADVRRAAHGAVAVDYRDRYGLVATRGADARIVGHAGYDRSGADRAEIAFAVADPLQGRGVATILLAHLAEWAEQCGVAVFEAEVLSENHRMIEVFRESGFPVRTRSEVDAIVVEFPASLSEDARERFERRDDVAAVAAARALLEPKSVAVIGASRERGTVGGELFHNLLTSRFAGPVYPVNRDAESVQAVVAYPSIGAIPGAVDLAVIAVPAGAVIDVARECAAKQVRAIVVISAGFAESGEAGAERQRELVAVCRGAGVRIVGPNCMGVVNTDPAVALNATFAPTAPTEGGVALMSQSGALGLAAIDLARELGIGVSGFVSVGNKADVSGNDLLRYWHGDTRTRVILLYLESFGNPRKFARIAREVSRTKPVLAVKSGRSSAGARATSSHTGALIAASDVTVDALFRQAGVVRTDTLAELFDAATLLSSQPVPAGSRVGVVTNAGGLGILCADACEANGLDVVEFPPELRERLGQGLPGEATLANPVDTLAAVGADAYRRALETVAKSGVVDSLIALFIPPLAGRDDDVPGAIDAVARDPGVRIPIVAVVMEQTQPPPTASAPATVPTYGFPEEAARALALGARYGEWRTRPRSEPVRHADVRRDKAAAIVARALAEGLGWLTLEQCAALLDCYRIPRVEQLYATSPEGAGDHAEALGGPVALKALASGLLHKSDVGGVRVGLSGADEVTGAAVHMEGRVARAGHSLEGFVVQPVAPPGIEMLVGVVQDELFGPVLACGAGGVAVELVGDVSVRLTPLTRDDATDMVRSLATLPLLEGYRGAPAVDLGALTDILLRVSDLVESHAEVVELDCNPVVVTPDGARVVDVRVRVEPAAAPSPLPAVGA